MRADDFVLPIAILAFVVTAVVTTSYFFSIPFSPQWLTGHGAADTATINVTVAPYLAINFSTASINWSSGRVTGGSSNATLNTAGGANNVTNGNWTGNTDGLVIENVGNIIANLSFKAGKNASTFLGGTNPSYQFNVTNKEGNSCVRNSSAFGFFIDVNTTGDGTFVCDIFNFTTTNNSIRVDLRLVIPSDSFIGALSDTITATVY